MVFIAINCSQLLVQSQYSYQLLTLAYSTFDSNLAVNNLPGKKINRQGLNGDATNYYEE